MRRGGSIEAMAARRPPPGKCAAYGVIGRKKRRIHGSGRYAICLSPSQKRDLFGEGPLGKRGGCGTFACVWPSATAERVVKVTKDREDVDGLLRAQGLPRVVKVYRAVELKDAGTDLKSGRTIPIYAIEAERLSNVPRENEEVLQRPLEATRLVMLGHAKKRHGADPKTFRVPEQAKQEIPQRACAKVRRGDERASCEIFIGQYIETFEQLAQRGILWQDTHFGNIGIDAKGRWRALDLGYSGTKEHAEIPTLAGARRRRRR